MKTFLLNFFRLIGGKKFVCTVIDITNQHIICWFYVYGFQRHKVRARVAKKIEKIGLHSMIKYFIDVDEREY